MLHGCWRSRKQKKINNMKYYTIVLGLLLAGSGCFAQSSQPEIKEDFKPSILNQPGQEYPQVNSQGYARFKINAPAADSVRVSLGLRGRGGTKLIKSSGWFLDGHYSRTVGRGISLLQR